MQTCIIYLVDKFIKKKRSKEVSFVKYCIPGGKVQKQKNIFSIQVKLTRSPNLVSFDRASLVQ